MIGFRVVLTASVACASVVLAGCAASGTSARDDVEDPQNLKAPTCSYIGEPYQPPVFPAASTPQPPDLRFPASPSAAGEALTSADYHLPPYKITGYTSFFGGFEGNGFDSPGGFALSQAWNNSVSSISSFAEGGLKYPLDQYDPGPCNDNPAYTPQPYTGNANTGNFRSYYGAIRVTPSLSTGLDYSTGGYQQLALANASTYDDWYDSRVGTKDPIYAKMFLYNRPIIVTRTLDDGTPRQIIIRAVDRGPVESDPYWQRAVDLSPWAMGALNEDPACLDFNGTTPTGCDITGPGSWTKPSWQVSVCWAADFSRPPGPVPAADAKCLGEV